MRSFSAYVSAIARLGVSIFILNSAGFAQMPFPDTLWVPVIFYDYHADGRGDFETCEDPNSDVGMKGMVTATLDTQRKPVPVPSIACPTVASSFPCACHLGEWFRVSGQNGSDNTAIFQCDSLTDPDKPRWSWSGLVPYQGRTGEYVGPNYNANYAMANVIIYDSLCFELVPISNGVYQFINDDFLPLNDRGFGDEPLAGDGNFGFAMELHTKFKYQEGLSFSFRGDDDVWAFINGKLAMDLGGTHYYMDGYIDLDTIADLVPGQIYSFDLYYAERHSTGSHIRITSNVISASPSEVHISVFPSDTIKAGDTVTIVGTVTDEDGDSMPIQSDSISWTQVSGNSLPGDRIIIPRNDTTQFTGTVAYRRVGIIGTYRFGTSTIIDTTWIYIKPADPAQVDISMQNATALTREQVTAGIDTFAITPVQTITLTMGQSRAYAYAVLRDRFGNYCALADSATWASQNTAAATVDYVVNGAFEGVIGRPGGVLNASATVIVSRGTLIPDTAQVILVADTLVALRLVDITNPDVALDNMLLTTDSSITVKVQGIWSTAPGVWVDLTGIWTLQPADAVSFFVPVPAVLSGQWKISPFSSGTTTLKVVSLNASVSVPIIVKQITKLRLVNLERPTSPVAVLRMSTDSSLTVKLQGAWSTDTTVWVDLDGMWSLDPSSSITFTHPLPGGSAGQWMVAPTTPGTTRLTVTSHGKSVTVPVVAFIGPYVLEAQLSFGIVNGNDILKIRFSTPIRCASLEQPGSTPEASFKIFAPGDSLRSTVLEGARYLDEGTCSSVLITEVTIVLGTNGKGIVPGRDSIVLFGSAVDSAGNHPDVTRRGRIVYGPGAGISVLSYENPDPAVSPMVLPQDAISTFGLQGELSREMKLIMIRTDVPLKPDTLPDGTISYGKSVVFDPVGNLVAEELPLRRAPSNDRLYSVVWNGFNRSRRKVASGAYLLRASVRYINNPEASVYISNKFRIQWK